jgi:hypothetical protein
MNLAVSPPISVVRQCKDAGRASRGERPIRGRDGSRAGLPVRSRRLAIRRRTEKYSRLRASLPSEEIPMRKLVPLVLLLVVAAVWFRPEPVVSGSAAVAIFPLSIKGKTYQPAVTFGGPGAKSPIGKLNDKVIAQVLQGTLPDFAADYLDLDPSGRFFVYFDGRGSNGIGTFRVATNPNGIDTTTMDASITNDGFFWAVGKYTMPVIGGQADINMTGKMTFVKGTYTPKKITGVFNFRFVGGFFNETFTMKFKTLAPVA